MAQQGFYVWSTTASSNGNADTSVNFLEGQAPSSLNDSSRAAMARLREWGNDIAGAIVTGGSSTAYTVTSSQVFDTLAHLNGQVIAFTPHTTNGATVTLNVDSLGAKPLRSAPSTEIPAGTLIQGTPYAAVYNNSDAVFYLQGFYGNPYSIPLGGMLDFTGTSTPNSSFVFPAGQAISRTTYAAYFALVGTTYGTGDGSTTFNVIDMTGRIAAMKEASATRLTSTYFGGDSTALGAHGGVENQTLGLGHIPATLTVNGTVTVTPSGGARVVPTTSSGDTPTAFSPTGGSAIAPISGNSWTYVNSFSGTNTLTANNTGSNASGGAKNLITVQPTIIVNKILRVI